MGERAEFHGVGADRVELAERMARIEAALGGMEAGQAQLREALSEVLKELKGRSDAQEGRIRAVEIQQAQVQGVLSRRVEELEERLGEVSGQVTAVEETADRMMPAVRIATWVAGVLGTAALMLLWGLVTREAQVLFK